MQSRRLLVLALLGITALALPAAPASGHHPLDEEAASMWLLGGQDKSVFNELLAADPPLEGIGENMKIVANLPLAPGTVPGGANDASFPNNAVDLELAGEHAYVGSYTQGLVIANISTCNDPTQPARCKPVVQGVYPCSGGQFDIQLSPDAKVAVMAHESASTGKKCHPGEEGVSILDVSDKSSPKEIAFISDEKPDGSSSGMVVDGAHNVTLDWPNLYVDQYTQTYGKTEVFNLATPSQPKKVGELAFPVQNGQSGFHDSYPDHRPDGKHLLYGASIQKSDIVDIADPTKPKVLQTIADPQVGISHGAEPNYKRDLLIVTDEYGGGTGVGACGGNPDPDIPLPGQGQQITSVGAVHFYKLNQQGLVGASGTDKAGIFNIQLQPNEPDQVANEAGCTSHVFWQAPDQNRMTIAWYGRGTRIVDFKDPANPKQLGFFVPEGADTWSAKPHCGFIFTGDMVRGMDVLAYTGEKGAAWPASSGKADFQRAQTQSGGSAPAPGPCVAGSAGVGDAGADTCAEPPKGARAKRFGRVRLGQRRKAVRRAYGGPGAYRRFTDRYCLDGGGGVRVGYASGRALGRLSGPQRRRIRGRAILILSSSPRSRVGGVRVGTSVATLRKRRGVSRGLRVGRNVWYTRRAKGRTLVFKVRGGRVAEVGLANRGLTASGAQVRRFFRLGR